MAAKNNDRITDAIWYFQEQCIKLSPGSKSGGIGPGDPEQKGYHNYPSKLYAVGYNSSTDYSIRYAPDLEGPSDKYAAFDWVFPDAQNGNYSTIRLYMTRIKDAFDNSDSRLDGFREALGQQDADSNPEGFDFLLNSTRTPDMTHMWHIHFSILRKYVNDFFRMNAMLSVLAGESLYTWLSGRSRFGGGINVGSGDKTQMIIEKKIGGNSSYWISDGITYRTFTSWPSVEAWEVAQGPRRVVTSEAEFRDLAGAPAAGDITWLQVAMAESAKREASASAALDAMLKLLGQGGGSPDSAAIISAVREAIQVASDRETAAVANLQNELAEMHQRMAEAAQAEADRLKG